MSYRIDLSIIDEVNSYVKTERNKLAFQIDGRVIKATPFDTGEARVNWIVTDGRPTDQYTGTVELSSSSANNLAIEQGRRAINSAKTYTKLYIQDNAPHIGLLNEGSSEQARTGYIDTIIAEEVARDR